MNLFSSSTYSSSPVESCLRQTQQVKHLRWKTRSRAFRTRSCGEIPCRQPEHLVPNRLKKSVLQNSFPSRLKHLSVRAPQQSAQRTHSACQVLSSTVRRNLSRMGLSQPAQQIIIVVAVTVAWWDGMVGGMVGQITVVLSHGSTTVVHGSPTLRH